MDYLPHEGCPTLVPNPAFRYSLRPTTVTAKYPNTKFVSRSTFNHLVPPEREVIPPCGSSQTQNSVQTITVTQDKPSTPTRQNGKKQLDKESSVSVMSLHHSRGRAGSNHTWSFCHPNCVWLTRFKPNKTLSNTVQVLRACVRGKEDQSSDDLSELAALKAVAFPQFSGQRVADKCKRVRSETGKAVIFVAFIIT